LKNAYHGDYKGKPCPKTFEDRNVEFDIETYKDTDMFQFLHSGYSTWFLMCKYFDCKKLYYETGQSKITDREFDALENTIDVSNKIGFLEDFGGVGYDINKHIGAKVCLDFYESELKRRYTKKHNAYALAQRIERENNQPFVKVEDFKIEKEVEEILIQKVYENNELGQFEMF